MSLKTIVIACLAMPVTAHAQVTTDINDSNTPLHLLTPDYKHKYGVSTKEEVKASIDRGRVMNKYRFQAFIGSPQITIIP